MEQHPRWILAGWVSERRQFFGKLASKSGLALDLPTEAQWEYACRAGTTTAWNNRTDITDINDDPQLDLLGCYWYNDGGSHEHAEIGSYQPNAGGLYDMHGNVYEWCLDWYDVYDGDATDPEGPSTGSARVLRGGSWFNYARIRRAAYRVSRSRAGVLFSV